MIPTLPGGLLRRAVALAAAAALIAPAPALAAQVEKASLDGVEAGRDQVTIHLSRPVQYNAFTTAEPPRLVVELLNTEHEGASQYTEGSGEVLDKVRAGQYQRDPSPIARVVLYLKKLVSYRARWDGSKLRIDLLGGTEPAAPAAAPGPAGVPVPEKIHDAPAENASLDGIDASADAVAVRLSGQVAFNAFTTDAPPRLVVDFQDTERAGGPLSAAGRGRLIEKVRAGQYQREPKAVTRVVIYLKKLVSYRAKWDGPTLRVELLGAAEAPADAKATADPLPEPPAKAPAAKAPATAVAAKAPVPVPVSAGLPVSSEKAPAEESASLPKNMTTETSGELARMAGAGAPKAAAAADPGALKSGRLRRDILATLPSDPVTLDFDSMDIHDVLAMLATKANINIVPGADVNGSVTLALHDVPFNEAFFAVLSNRGLVANQVGENILRVLTPGSLVSERAVAVNQTRVIKLKYSKAGVVSASISAVAAAEGRKSSIIVDEPSNSLILTDTLEGIAAAERLLSELDVRPQQVQIEAKLVEVDLNKDMSLGIQWDYLSSDEAPLFNQSGRNMIGTVANPKAASSPMLPPLQNNVNATAGDGAAKGRGTGVFLPATNPFGAFTFGRVTNNYFLSATLTAAASQNKAKVLSDPKVTTLNGKLAKIDITTSIPFVTTETTPAGGGTTTTAQKVVFQETGIQLEVTPTINADGRITVEVKPSVKQPSQVAAAAGTTGAQAIDTRMAQTVVIVQDGGTIVIGGLITDSMQDLVAKVPLLGDIPIIGMLFRKTFTTRKRVELLIFVTTKIVPS